MWTPQPGPLRAALLFRTGQADEVLACRGLTHLAEHLVLENLGLPHDEVNGTVGLLHTSFVTRGRPEEVTQFVNTVVAGLADPPLAGLARNVAILRTEAEAEGRGRGPLGRHLRLRFGATGPALACYDEYGLDGLDPAQVTAWAQSVFQARNAALCLSGPPPAGLDLSPLGGAGGGTGPAAASPAPLPRLRPVARPYPAWDVWAPGSVSFSLLMRRTVAAMQAASAFTGILFDELRTTRGLSYTVTHGWEPLDADLAHVVFLADCRAEVAAGVRDLMISAASHFAVAGPSPQAMAAATRKAVRAVRDPDAAFPYVIGCALDHLMGRPLVAPQRRCSELAALRPGDLAAEFAGSLASGLWLVPEEVGMRDRRFRHVEDRPVAALPGHTLARPPGTKPEAAHHRLVVGQRGVSLVLCPESGETITVPFAQCEALLCWPDGVRGLVGSDGRTLVVHPLGWRDGAWAVAALDVAIGAHLRVHRAEPFGPPASAASPAKAPAPHSRGSRLRRR